MLDSFYNHLQRCAASGNCPHLLPNALLFCFEVSRLEEMIHKNNDPLLLSRKVESIIGVFLESQLEPRIQVDIPLELVVRMCKQGHFFAKNEQYSEISGFIEGYEKLFKALCPYFAAFHRRYKPSTLAAKNPEKSKRLRLMDQEMQRRHDDWKQRCTTPKLVYTLPKIQQRSKHMKGFQVTFSFEDGIKCKVSSLKSKQLPSIHCNWLEIISSKNLQSKKVQILWIWFLLHFALALVPLSLLVRTTLQSSP